MFLQTSVIWLQSKLSMPDMPRFSRLEVVDVIAGAAIAITTLQRRNRPMLLGVFVGVEVIIRFSNIKQGESN